MIIHNLLSIHHRWLSHHNKRPEVYQNFVDGPDTHHYALQKYLNIQSKLQYKYELYFRRYYILKMMSNIKLLDFSDDQKFQKVFQHSM
jgi:hypothetical protein